jgi:hypothetical protein
LLIIVFLHSVCCVCACVFLSPSSLPSSPSALGGLVGFEAFAAGVGGGDADLKDFDDELEVTK